MIEQRIVFDVWITKKTSLNAARQHANGVRAIAKKCIRLGQLVNGLGISNSAFIHLALGSLKQFQCLRNLSGQREAERFADLSVERRLQLIGAIKLCYRAFL